MIPVRDTLGEPRRVPGTLLLLVVNVLLFATGLYDAGIWALLVGLAGTWLFGAPLESRFGTWRLLIGALALFGVAGLVAGAIAGGAAFQPSPLGAVFGLGLGLLALIPRCRILVLSPIPFAMGFQEVPAAVVVAVWAVLAWLAG